MKQGLVVVRGQTGWLARAKPAAHQHGIVNCAAEQSPPLFAGDPAAYVATAPDEETRQRLAEQLRNKVRKCRVCNKPNAFTLTVCNGCSSDLSDVEIGFTNNVFSSFVLGIAKGPFPFVVSMRRQSEEMLVIDDLLALTRVHLNCIPATRYIPDFLTLLQSPHRGLALIDAMFEECWRVVEEQFWPKREALFSANATSLAELRRHVIAGFNWPPSQYQLHLQFMLPPMLPFQMLACTKRVHFTFGRFFPFEYVRAMLKCPTHYPWKETSPIEELFDFYRSQHGLNYATVHAQSYERYMHSNDVLANWNPADFQGAVCGSQFLPFGANGEPQEAATEAIESAEAVAAADKLVLQNYGRPYDAAGKPSGTYYKYAKREFPEH